MPQWRNENSMSCAIVSSTIKIKRKKKRKRRVMSWFQCSWLVWFPTEVHSGSSWHSTGCLSPLPSSHPFFFSFPQQKYIYSILYQLSLWLLYYFLHRIPEFLPIFFHLGARNKAQKKNDITISEKNPKAIVYLLS